MEKRLELIVRIMQEKKEHGLPVFSHEREKELLQQAAESVRNPDFADEIKNMYAYVQKSCRKIQSRRMFPYQITLVGFMGSGKTTIGRELARLLAMDQIDIDRVIEERAGTTITRIFEEHGEPYFRELERKTAAEMNARKNAVVFCSGGGFVLDDRNIETVKKNGPVVWLKASPGVIHQRIVNEGNRPVLKDGITVENIQARMEKRLVHYEKAADLIVDTDGKTTEQISLEIVEKLMRLKLDRKLQD